jgi:hypothetical protein
MAEIDIGYNRLMFVDDALMPTTKAGLKFLIDYGRIIADEWGIDESDMGYYASEIKAIEDEARNG